MRLHIRSSRMIRLVTAAATVGALLALPPATAASAESPTVPVGSYPIGLAVNPVTNTVYVTNFDDDSVSVIDGSTNTVTSTVPVGSHPREVAVNPSTNTVYVTNFDDDSVSVIDGSTNTVTSTVSVGPCPVGVAVNPSTNTVYVPISGCGIGSGGTVMSVINGSTNTVTATVQIGFSDNGYWTAGKSTPWAVAVNPVTNTIYVTDATHNALVTIDGSTNNVIAKIRTGGFWPEAVAVNPLTNTVYVASPGTTSPSFGTPGDLDANRVSVIDGSTGALTAVLRVGRDVFALAVNPLTNSVYSANNHDNSVSVINGSTNTVTTTFSVGSNPLFSRGSAPTAVAVNPLTNTLYVANSGNNSVSVITAPSAPTVTSAVHGNTQATIAWTDGASNGAAITAQTIYVYSGSTLITTKTDCSASPCTVTGLTNGSSYTFKVSNTNGIGEGALSPASSAVTPAAVPDAPTITSSTRGIAQATVAWTDGASNGSDITAQTIYVYSGSTLVTIKTNCSGSPCTVTGLSGGTSYTFKVSNTNGVGEGALSAASSAVIPAAEVPDSPTITSVTRYNTQATVVWTDGSSNGSAITVQTIYVYSGSTLVTTKTNCPGSPCTVTGLNGGTSYTFKVSNTNGVGEGALSAASGTTSTVSVGSTPSALAVNSSTNTVYVANLYGNSVSVIDGSTNTVTATVSVGNNPYGVAVNPSTNTIYVANLVDNTVSVIDGSTNTVTSTVSVGNNPRGVSVNPSTNTIYVANYSGASVSVINGSTNTVTATVLVRSGPDAVAVNPSTNTIYVANSSPYNFYGNSVSVIDGSTNTVTSTVAVGNNPRGVSVNPSTNTIYVTNHGDNTVSVIDGSTNTVTATVSVGNNPRGVSVNPSTNTIYVANYSGASVSVINGSTNTVTATVSVRLLPVAVAVNLWTNTVYVANSYGDSVSVMNAPLAPTITSATRGNAQATITWTAGDSNGAAITAQTIYVYSGASLVSTKTDCSGSPCTVMGLSNGTSYTFKVSNTNGMGEGALSSASSAVTPATNPGAPQSVSVIASGSQAIVSWAPPVSNGGSPIISYVVATMNGSHSCSYTVTTPATDTCTVTGLTNGSSYTFVVTATNNVGAGVPSTGAAATVLYPGPVLTKVVAATNQVTLTWTAPTVTNGKIVSFIGSVTDGNGHSSSCNVSKAARKCTITGLTNLTTYVASVVAIENNGGTTSASSNLITVTPAQPLTLPFLYPVALTSALTGNYSAAFAWGAAGGGDGQTPSYELRVFNPNGSIFYSTTTLGNMAAAPGLTKGVKYSFNVTVSTSASTSGLIPWVTTKSVRFTAK